MGKLKRCRICGDVLYCQKCGTRQTPETPERKKYTVMLTDEEREPMEKRANELGISIAELIRRTFDPSCTITGSAEKP